MSDAALALHDVHFGYAGSAERVLDGVSLTVAAGTAVALLGPNGAGKSTLLRLGMALAHPRTGRVVSAGLDTAGRTPEALAPRVGFVFQDPGDQLFASSVRAELAFGPRQLGWAPAAIGARIEELLPRLGLADVADRHPYDLPLPLRRLVALGCALMPRPALLLLDEPSAGLDRVSHATLCRVVREEAAAGAGVLAVTHDPIFALEALDRAVLLRDGRLAADGAPDALFASGDSDLPALPATVRVARGLGLAPVSCRRADLAAALAAHLTTAR